MTARLAIAFLLLLCIGGLGLAVTINSFAIVDAVHAKLPTDAQFGQLGWGPLKTLRLRREYRRLYPDGTLLMREGILSALMWVCIVVVAWLIRLPLFGIAWLGAFGTLLLWLICLRKGPTI
jgi:hypothetical protein